MLVTNLVQQARRLADRTAFFLAGECVEIGETEQIITNPQHPYTQALLSAVPNPDPRARRERVKLEGDVPSPRRPPSGCSFHPRCFCPVNECRADEPVLRHIGGDHWVACHR